MAGYGINRDDLEEMADELMIGEGMFDASDFLPEGEEFCGRCGDAVPVDHLETDTGYCLNCDDEIYSEHRDDAEFEDRRDDACL